MIHPNTNLSWLDIQEEKHYKGTINDLMKHYAHRIHRIDEHHSVIAFGAENGPKIKVQDWTGWTDVQTIWKVPVIDDQWMKITAIDYPDLSIIVTTFELIPAYKVENTKRGFHGEIKYKYFLKHPARITKNDALRTRGIEGPNNSYFVNVDVNYVPSDERYGYQILTISNFINLNQFHMYSSDFADIDIKSGQMKGYK